MIPESVDVLTRQNILIRLIDYFNHGYRDPELLYQGMRFAVSLRLAESARRFYTQLETMLVRESEVSSAYLPVGMLFLQVAELDEREVILNRIRSIPNTEKSLIDKAETIARNANIPMVALAEDNEITAMFARYLHDNLQFDAAPSEVILHRLLGGLPNQPALSTNEIGQLHQLIRDGNRAYEDADIHTVRAKLERALMIDGTQADVLRNLITVAADQQDNEAYQRYWRRYVHVNLRQLLYFDSRPKAWADLIRFYVYVSDAIEKELNLAKYTSIAKLKDLIRRPGFLYQWLEVHIGLVWLEALQKSHYVWQVGQPDPHRQANNIALARYWLHLFYPEFAPYFGEFNNENYGNVLPSIGMELKISFNPTARTIKRFVQWSEKLQMGIRAQEDGTLIIEPQLELALATVQSLFRLPITIHFQAIRAALQELDEGDSAKKSPDNVLDRLKSKSWILSACAKRLYLDDGQVEKFYKIYRNPEIHDMLNSNAFLNAAFALAERFPSAALDISINALDSFTSQELAIPDTVPEEPDKVFREKYAIYLTYRNLRYSVLNYAFEAERSPNRKDLQKAGVTNLSLPKPVQNDTKIGWLSLFTEQLKQFTVPQNAQVFFDKFVEENRIIFENQVFNIIYDLMNKHAEEKNMREALNVLRSASFETDNITNIHNSLLAQIGVIAALNDGNIAEARQWLKRIENVEEQREMYDNLAGQIEIVEHNQIVEPIIKRVREYMDERDWYNARHEAQRIPDFAEETRLFFIAQIDVFDYLNKGQIAQARSAASKLPESLANVRNQLLEIIQNAEQADRINKQIEEAIDQIRTKMQSQDYRGARQIVDSLPRDLATLKQQLHDQINESEEIKGYVDHVNATTNGHEALRRAKAIPMKYAEIRNRLISQLNGMGYY